MMTVFHPRLNADETSAAVASLEEQVAAHGGEMIGTDNWGRRRLAYPIDGVVDGTYVLLTFRMPAEGTAPLERWIRLSEMTLRHLLIRGIIPFEGDRSGRDDRDRDDRDRDDRDRDDRDRDEDGERAFEQDEPRAVTSSAPAEAADTSVETSSEDGSESPAPAAEATGAEAAADAPSDETPAEEPSSDDED